MKIEKVNDNQIRCTLTKADLADRQLKLSELAYGTEKAKDLFRDMMQQANLKFGFEAEDIPLMIEAIPLSGDCIVLIITKVEDPEELDTRFSKFAPALQDLEDSLDDSLSDLADLPETADEILDLFRKVQNSTLAKHLENIETDAEEPSLDNSKMPSKGSHKESQEEDRAEEPAEITKLVSFSDLNTLSLLANMLNTFYQGNNSLYRNPENGQYYLVISQSGHSPEDYNRLCNILSEHGRMEHYSHAREAYMQEHFKTIIKNQALHALAVMEQEAGNQ